MPHEPCPHSASVAALLADPLTQLDASLAAHLPGCPACRRAATAAVRRWPAGRGPSPSLAEWLGSPDTRETVLSPFQVELLARGRARELELGPYLLLRKLGAGGMGEVYLGRHRFLQREDAVKTLRPDLAESATAVKRFLREAESVAKLRHPNVVHVYTADRAAAGYYLAMEFVPGADLNKFAKAHGPLPVPLACALLAQAADGVQHAFAVGIVHRDLKPGNLLLTWNGGGAPPDLLAPEGAALPPSALVVKVADFGLARALAPDEAGDGTSSGAVLGTADYMAPEQAADARAADTRADVYSLGCTLYYLLAGSVPFPGGSAFEKLGRHAFEPPAPLANFRTDLPPALVALVARCMAKRPDDRVQTPGELAAALRPFARTADQAKTVLRPLDLPDRAEDRTASWADLPPEEPDPRRVRGREPNRRGWLLAGAAVALVGLVAGVAWLAGGPKRDGAKADSADADNGTGGVVTVPVVVVGPEPHPRAKGPAPWAYVGSCPSARTDKVRAVGFAADGSVVAGRGGTQDDGSDTGNWERWARPGEKPLYSRRPPGTQDYEFPVYAGPAGLVTDYRRRFDPLTLARRPDLPADLSALGGGEVTSIDNLRASGDGKYLVAGVSAGPDGAKKRFAVQWNAETGRVVGWPVKTDQDIGAVAADRTGHVVAAGTGEGRVYAFSTKGREYEREWVGPPTAKGAGDPVSAVAVAPDGNAVYSAHAVDGPVHVWARDADRPRRTLPVGWQVYQLAVSPDGRWLAAAGYAVVVYDLRADPPVAYELAEHWAGDLKSAAFGGDGKRLVVGGWARSGASETEGAPVVWVWELRP